MAASMNRGRNNEVSIDTEKTVSPSEALNTNVMLYLDGSKHSFQCDCKANVFTKLSEDRYRCNGCATEYETEAA